MVKALAGYVWPADNPEVRKRVGVALGLLGGAKLVNTSVPILFKQAVDVLGAIQTLDGANPTAAVTATASAATALSLVVGYSIARMSASGFNELRNAVFARVAQHSIRTIALNVFRHLHRY